MMNEEVDPNSKLRYNRTNRPKGQKEGSMKKMIMATVIAAALSPSLSEAQCCQHHCETPKPKVITKTKVVTKVVEKKVPVEVVKEVIKVVDRPVPVTVTRTVYKKVQKKNRLSLLGGLGPNRLSLTPSEARLDRGPVVGAQYQRMLGESLSLGVQVQSNETVLGSVGIDF